MRKIKNESKKKISNDIFKRKCPTCKRDIVYTTKGCLTRSLRVNGDCRNCALKNPDRCLHLSKLMTGKPGRPHRAESKLKCSLSKIGIPLSPAHRQAVGDSIRIYTKLAQIKARKQRKYFNHFINGKYNIFSYYVGMTLNEFREYISIKFTPDMSWENHGTIWHLDHIKPLSSFNVEDDDQMKIAWHYTNFQPLYCKENLQKGAKLNFLLTRI